MTEKTTEIALLPPKETALQVFTAEAGLDPYLAKIKAELDAFTPDVATKKGRDAIASIAHKVARSKTALDNVGKELVAELKDVPKKIDAERKRMRDLMDQWKDDVRKPLTDWEEAQEARKREREVFIETMGPNASLVASASSEELQKFIGFVEARVLDPEWLGEYEHEAMRAKANTLNALRAALEKRQAYEAEQAELARLRAEAAVREQQDREAKIAREAEEKARRDAESAAQAERDAVAKREAEAKASAERRELELKLAAEKAEREKLEAQQAADRAQQESEARAQAAAAAERQRIADEQAAEAAETKRREANRAHKASVNGAAKEALMQHASLTEAQAKAVIAAIYTGAIPAITISY